MFKKGFTLAEVLITITILGVVAVLTIPALKTDIDKTSWAQGLKVNYYNIQQGFHRMLADQGVDSLGDTELADIVPMTLLYKPNSSSGSSSGGGDGEEEENENEATNEAILKEMSKYFSIQKMDIGVPEDHPIRKYSGAKYTSEISDSLKFYLENGSIMYIRFGRYSAGSNAQKYGTFGPTRMYIDVNGEKGPNTLGKDIFYIYRITDDGNLVLYGLGIDSNVRWDTASGVYACTDEAIKTNKSNGLTCGARVFEQGFKITY